MAASNNSRIVGTSFGVLGVIINESLLCIQNGGDPFLIRATSKYAKCELLVKIRRVSTPCRKASSTSIIYNRLIMRNLMRQISDFCAAAYLASAPEFAFCELFGSQPNTWRSLKGTQFDPHHQHVPRVADQPSALKTTSPLSRSINSPIAEVKNISGFPSVIGGLRFVIK
jgi:hypothetical protein